MPEVNFKDIVGPLEGLGREVSQISVLRDHFFKKLWEKAKIYLTITKCTA